MIQQTIEKLGIDKYLLYMESEYEKEHKKFHLQQILKIYNIEKYTIHDDGSVTAHQNVNISSRNLTKIPINFREVEGSFYCPGNNLISLEGSPQKVKGDFNCSSNKLISLIGAPLEIGENFYCYCNYLINLEGIPQIIKGDFSCYGNPKLFNLNNLPLIYGNIICTPDLREDINYKRHYLKKQIRDIK